MSESTVDGAEFQRNALSSKQTSPNSTIESLPLPPKPKTFSSEPTTSRIPLDFTPNEDVLTPSGSASTHGVLNYNEELADEAHNFASTGEGASNEGYYCPARGSVGSSSPSEAGSMLSSTYEHGQEHFDTFKAKVIQLCHDIGYGKPIAVERMEGDSFNRIIGLTFGSPEKDCVLRIPRQPYDDSQEHEISDQVGVLLHLAQFDSLKVPAIFAYDTTIDNAINSQWVLQARLPGKPIQDVFYQLPIADRIQITEEIAKLAIEMNKTKLPKPGRLIGSRLLPPTATKLSMEAEISFTGFKATENLSFDEQPLAQFLSGLFEFFKQNELTSDHPNKTATQKMIDRWSKLQEINSQMEQSGLMRTRDSSNMLWHWDICARNVLIDQVTVNERHASGQDENGAGAATSDVLMLSQKSSANSDSKGCQHSVQFSVGEPAGKCHKHTVHINIEDSSATYCNHEVEVKVEDSIGRKYRRHTLAIENAQDFSHLHTQEVNMFVKLEVAHPVNLTLVGASAHYVTSMGN